MKIALIPGSFDPVTNGHMDIIERGANIFDQIIVAVMHNSSKKPLFSLEEKLALLQKSTHHLENVKTTSFDGLLIDFARENNVSVLLKGLRSISDYDYEAPMAVMNQRIDSNIETVFLHTSPAYAAVSSTIVKEAAKYQALPQGLVPDAVEKALLTKFK